MTGRPSAAGLSSLRVPGFLLVCLSVSLPGPITRHFMHGSIYTPFTGGEAVRVPRSGASHSPTPLRCGRLDATLNKEYEQASWGSRFLLPKPFTLGAGLWSLSQSKPSIFGARSELRIGAAGRTRPFHLHPNGHFSFDMAFDAPWISAAGSEELKRGAQPQSAYKDCRSRVPADPGGSGMINRSSLLRPHSRN